MQKNELLSLADEMCKKLITTIQMQEKITKEQFANYLFQSAELIIKMDEKDLSSTNFTQALFHNAYKELAKKSLDSYSHTNNNIEKLSQIHEETLQQCNKEDINLKEIINKFNTIQTDMTNEVNKANEIIKNLNQQIKTLEKTSNLDPLTKVFNRRALSTYLKDICSKEKSPDGLYVLILDIDDFKKINDTHGHLAGDKILIFIANMLRKTLRDGDKIFRYGGEEFVIILNRLNDAQCTSITNRILELIRENRLIYKGVALSVTMSIGVTKFTKGDTPDSLIYRADKALYRAKDKGKNQMHRELTNGI